MSEIYDTQVSPETAEYIEHELSCPFCEGSFYAVETILGNDNDSCDHYHCSCGGSWEVILLK